MSAVMYDAPLYSYASHTDTVTPVLCVKNANECTRMNQYDRFYSITPIGVMESNAMQKMSTQLFLSIYLPPCDSRSTLFNEISW